MGASKQKKLIEQVRKRAFENRNGLYVPRTEGDIKTACWPVCMTCHQDVDSVNVEDVNRNTVDIRAKCHGQECTIRLEFPFQILNRNDADTWHHVRSAMNNATYFDTSIAL